MSRSVQNIGICGIGQMGSAAAVSFKRAGYRVLLWARNPEKLAAVGDTLRTLEDWMDAHVGPPLQESGNIRRVDRLEVLDDESDLVMDCIAE